MSSEFHKPALFGGREFEAYEGGTDPAAQSRAAHESAAAILTRARDSADPSVVKRLVHYTDEHGIDALAELWSHATAHSLPGALWRLYLVRLMIRSNPDAVSLIYTRGTEVLRTIDALVAGAPTPAGPQEVVELADRILRGVFEGDFALALERAAAFCRVAAAGATSLADDYDGAESDRADALTRRALRLSTIAADLAASAGLARADSLD